jgi:hypothetical protein
MKKVFALILTLVFVFSMAVPAFAAKSPNGTVYNKVVIVDGNDHVDTPEQDTQKEENITHTTVVEGNTVKVKANPNKGKFDGWKIYKPDGKPAVPGVDYKVLGASTLSDDEIEIIPLATIVITANYNDVVTETIIVEDEEVSPPTGDATVVVLSAVALIALCGVIISKKQLAK